MFRSLLSTSLLLALAASAQSCTRNGTIVAGDTCDGVSLRYSISTYQLAQANAGVIDAACGNLAIGGNVCLALQGMDCTSVYQVQAGDTCQHVADAFGIPLDTLYSNNPNVDSVTCDNIYVGEVLCVAGTTYPYPQQQQQSATTAVTAAATSSQPAAGSDTMTLVATATASSSSSAASASATSPSSGLEYCADDDTSEDCVDESELPYCDEI